MSKIKLNINGTILGKTVGGDAFKWTIADEALHRGSNYADANLEIVDNLRKEEGMSMYAVLKNAYQQGFLDGFGHKFDSTNYEEKRTT
jgi:hypothetical protein